MGIKISLNLQLTIGQVANCRLIGKLKVDRNYSYVASTTAINNAAASQLLTINN